MQASSTRHLCTKFVVLRRLLWPPWSSLNVGGQGLSLKGQEGRLTCQTLGGWSLHACLHWAFVIRPHERDKAPCFYRSCSLVRTHKDNSQQQLAGNDNYSLWSRADFQVNTWLWTCWRSTEPCIISAISTMSAIVALLVRRRRQQAEQREIERQIRREEERTRRGQGERGPERAQGRARQGRGGGGPGERDSYQTRAQTPRPRHYHRSRSGSPCRQRSPVNLLGS